MKFAIIGAGLMGGAIAQKLFENKIDVIAYNRTKSKLENLKTLGIKISDTPIEAIEQSEIIILMLADANAIKSVMINNEILEKLKNKVIVQMGTILPEESKEFQTIFTDKGAEYFEAPVLGSVPQILTETLIILFGGSKEQFQNYKNIFTSYSKDIYHIGEVGQAAAIKLAFNNLIASLIPSFSLSLGIVKKSNIDVNVFMEILRKSALYAPTFDSKLPMILSNDFSKANFPTKHLLKDGKLIEKYAAELNLNTKIINALNSVIEEALKSGFGENDYSSVYKVVSKE
ncbi:MAG: NAD(P)-dependent oxidoreductase [Ignavibacteria bacterium]|nr:NAD(P)-dependent oxidoreductase [Ignavibacteria bacterium]